MKRRVPGVPADKPYRAFSSGSSSSSTPYSAYGQQPQVHQNVGYSYQYFAQPPQQQYQQQQQQPLPPQYQQHPPQAVASPYLQQANRISNSNSNNNFAVPVNVALVEGNEKKRRGQLNKQKKLTAVSRSVLAFRRIFMAVCFILVGLQVGRFIHRKGFVTSNFILFDTVDLSPIIGLYYYYFGAQTCRPDMYYWNGIELFADDQRRRQRSVSGSNSESDSSDSSDPTEDEEDAVTFDCTFNLCSPITQGNEGRMYDGSCYLKTPSTDTTTTTTSTPAPAGRPVTRPVLLKSMKQRVGPWLRHEIAASQVIGKRTALQHYAHGFNFLLMSQLVDYRTIYDVHLDKESVPPLQLPNFLHQQGLQIMHQLRHLHRHGYLHLDVWAPNIMYQPHATTGRWDFQLVDFSSARPVAQANAVIQESMHNHFHLPKMPAMACLLDNDDNKGHGRAGRLTATSILNNHDKVMADYAAYCTAPLVDKAIRQHQLCPGFLDAYPLAIRMLRDLYTLPLNRPWPCKRLNKSQYPTFADILQKHEEYMEILRIVEKEHGQDHPTVQLIAEWTDISRLNATLVCDVGDGHHGQNK